MKKSKIFKIRKSSAIRLVGSYPKEAKALKKISRHLSFSSRDLSLAERVKTRKIIDSLLRNASRLEGKA